MKFVPWIRHASWMALVCLPMMLQGCGAGSPAPALSDIARLGELAFEDPSLSASGRLSCASCHAPETGHAAPNDQAVQMGGAQMDQAGLRSSPSIRYLQNVPPFHVEADGTPVGGFFWDGRAASLQDQAHGPLLGAREMANSSQADAVMKVTRTAWADRFRALLGIPVESNTPRAFDQLTLALQQFQLEDRRFKSFSSKYDEVLRGRARLSAQEARGLALFNAPDKGNCAACHPSSPGLDGQPPLFTDFSFDVLGLPRNPEIPANADPAYFDLGLCGRTELRDRTEWCGAFKVPSLRNVALRRALFHNGVFKSLKTALTFYVQRDTHPEKWYPVRADGSVDVFNDLPPAYRLNVNRSEAPYNRVPGIAPALSETDIDDVIAFLNTLTDGWVP